jgi:hypothetical protein
VSAAVNWSDLLDVSHRIDQATRRREGIGQSCSPIRSGMAGSGGRPQPIGRICTPHEQIAAATGRQVEGVSASEQEWTIMGIGWGPSRHKVSVLREENLVLSRPVQTTDRCAPPAPYRRAVGSTGSTSSASLMDITDSLRCHIAVLVGRRGLSSPVPRIEAVGRTARRARIGGPAAASHDDRHRRQVRRLESPCQSLRPSSRFAEVETRSSSSS